MGRPPSIVNFERCYLGSLVLGYIITAFGWDDRVAVLRANPAVARLGEGFMYGTMIGAFAISLVITLVLWWYAARRAQPWAKWVITVFYVIGALFMLLALIGRTLPGGLTGVLQVGNFVLQGVGVWLLFRPDSDAWFASAETRDSAEPFR